MAGGSVDWTWARRHYLPMQEKRPQLTLRQAAAVIGVSDKTARRYVASGALVYALKVPGSRGQYLFDFDTVSTFAAERTLRLLAMVRHDSGYPGRIEGEQTFDDLDDDIAAGQ